MPRCCHVCSPNSLTPGNCQTRIDGQNAIKPVQAESEARLLSLAFSVPGDVFCMAGATRKSFLPWDMPCGVNHSAARPCRTFSLGTINRQNKPDIAGEPSYSASKPFLFPGRKRSFLSADATSEKHRNRRVLHRFSAAVWYLGGNISPCLSPKGKRLLCSPLAACSFYWRSRLR